ncbi:hypothetical protein CMEL01_00944 [Colletotrichum melonis]|uniref:Uncharacterized protein n=1 Tax=Colletotrichum melonis TaxID=1209925 RepID=A0AAI9V5I7_9PEZI|nr:hypothetical protein CMEL01_00944 [Colletotrichum melonis]
MHLTIETTGHQDPGTLVQGLFVGEIKMANQKHFAVREKREKVQVHGTIGKKGRPGLMTRDDGWRERGGGEKGGPTRGDNFFSLFPVHRFLRGFFSYDRSLDDGARPSVETGLNPTRYPRSRRARVPTAARACARSGLEQDDDDRKAL